MPNRHRLNYHRDWAREKRLKEPAFNMFYLAKARAKRKNIDFDLNLSDLIIPEVCAVFGTPIAFGGKRNDAPSLDRVNPLKGYTKANIRIISNKANQLKSSSTLDDLEKIITYVKDHDESRD